jgi:hypothetical protein
MRRVEAPADPLTASRGNYAKAQTHDALSGRVDSGRGGLANSGRLHLTALPMAGTIGRAYPWAEAKGQDLSSTSILAHGPKKGKGQSDVPQLPNRMQAIWKDAEGPAAVSVLPVPENLF